MKEFYLKDIVHDYNNGERVCDWDYIECDGNIRIYYKPNGQFNSLKSGFSFYAVENQGCICNEITDINDWTPEYTFVECFFNGQCFFDGIRHLYMGDEKTDNYGYHYYPKISYYISFFEKLNTLEDMYCIAD